MIQFDSGLTPSHFYEQDHYDHHHTRLDSQFQPPFQHQTTSDQYQDIYQDQQQQQQLPPSQEIDQKIMENIQKYISHFMLSTSNNGQQQPLQYQSQQTQYMQPPQQLQVPLYTPQVQVPQPTLDSFNSTLLLQKLAAPQHLLPKSSLNDSQLNTSLKSDEFQALKLHIESLTKKIDEMGEHTHKLQVVIAQKDKEIQRVRSMNTLTSSSNLRRQPISNINLQKAKKDRSTQTFILSQERNQQEYETFSYLYDKDQDLIKSEKEALLKFMRREVVQNEEFMQRIRELEYEREELQYQVSHLQLRVDSQKVGETASKGIQAVEALPLEKEDRSISCQILTPKHISDLQQEIELLTVQLQDSHSLSSQLQTSLTQKEDQLSHLADSTQHQLYLELSLVKQQLQQKSDESEGLRTDQERAVWEREASRGQVEGLEARLRELESGYEEEVRVLRSRSQAELQKVQQEKQASTVSLRDKDGVIWELQTRLEEQRKVMQELEEAQKKKTKKKIECYECLKKDSEIQQLALKIDKIKSDQSLAQQDQDKSLRQKDLQIKEAQVQIDSLKKEVKNSVVNLLKQGGVADHQVQETIQKLQEESEAKGKLVEQMKTQMEKQAQSFMEAIQLQEMTQQKPRK